MEEDDPDLVERLRARHGSANIRFAKEEFDATMQEKFQKSISNVVGAAPSDVTIEITVHMFVVVLVLAHMQCICACDCKSTFVCLRVRPDLTVAMD